jgi:Tfp pilus assembly protein PilF
LEAQQFGPKRITPRIEELAERAVRLEPDQPTYLWYLLKIHMARRRDAEARSVARRLLEAAPEDTRAHALLALLLVEEAARPEQFAAVEAHLKAAASDPTTAPTRAYGHGVLALRRQDGEAAVRYLRQAAALDPGADVIHYKLALAEGLRGDAAAARKSMGEFRRRQERKRKESDLLGDIAQRPYRPELYERAARFYDAQGLPEQAGAIRAEARRRFTGAAAKREHAAGPDAPAAVTTVASKEKPE